MRLKWLVAMILVAGCADYATDVPKTTGTQSSNNCPPDNPCCVDTPESPIIIDMLGDGVRLTSAAEGVLWTLRPGQDGQWAWPEPGGDDRFLVLDRNGDGYITDSTEMFGSLTEQAPTEAPNGFEALRWFDAPERGGNGDWAITPADSVWSSLRLWGDSDHDAISQADEMITLDAAGVHAFPLVVVPSSIVDEHGNEARVTSQIIADAPVNPTAFDFWLRQGELQTNDAIQFDWTCDAWVYAIQGTDILTPCSLPSTAPFPIIGWGGMIARQVWSRSHCVGGANAAELKNFCITSVSDRVAEMADPWNAGSGGCSWLFPAFIDDPAGPPPYDVVGANHSAGFPGRVPRVQCSLVVTQVPGGGGGGGGGCGGG